jgi:hypothetical protein
VDCRFFQVEMAALGAFLSLLLAVLSSAITREKQENYNLQKWRFILHILGII